MALESWDVRDPARLITEIAERVPLEEDTAYVALVLHPSSEQRLLEVRRLELPGLLDDDDRISEELRTVARSFGIDCQPGPSQHLLMTVVVRPGRCVMGPNEGVWCAGWRYSNHHTSISTGDLMLVTEHGWSDLMSGEAGHEPRMAITDEG